MLRQLELRVPERREIRMTTQAGLEDSSQQTDSWGRGRVAVVAGGAGGIGEGITTAFASAGFTVAVNDRREEAGELLAARLREQGHKAIAVPADVTLREGADSVFARVLESWGRVDVFVNVVGGLKGMNVPVWDMTEDQFDFTIRLNLRPVFLCTQAALRPMMEKRSGSIINITSISYAGAPEHAHYAAAKAGVTAFTRSVATQVGPYNINVNAVAPGTTITPSVAQAGLSLADVDWAKENPLGRANAPHDIGAAVLFLASPGARNISGQVLTVAGGVNPSL
jgi:NAD(P)-dependent dehydrogenase (short-subunit alcohol dehydrogenase family)